MLQVRHFLAVRRSLHWAFGLQYTEMQCFAPIMMRD